MALIEVFHVCASPLPLSATGTPDIPQGLLVQLNSTGNVVPGDGDDNSVLIIGLAGDSRSAGTTSYTPESGSSLSRNPATSFKGALVIGARGAQQRFTQNRVSDDYNETLASGKITVYHSGGEFWTDQYEVIRSNSTTVALYTPGTPLFASGAETAGGTSLGEPEAAKKGRFTDELPSKNYNLGTYQVVAVTLNAPTAYPSGVPGTDVGFNSGLGGAEGGNSISWGTFLHIKLSV